MDVSKNVIAAKNFLLRKNYAVFAVTNACGNKCAMCSIWKDANKKFVSPQDFERLVVENNLGFVMLTGGDPLFHPQFKELLEVCERRGVLATVCSNLINLTEENLKQFNGSVFQWLVSFDSKYPASFGRQRGNENIFGQTTRGLELLKANKQNFVVSLTVTKINKNELDDTIDYCDLHKLPINFCLTDSFTETSFKLGNEEGVLLSDGEQAELVEKILALKKQRKVWNSFVFLNDARRFFKKEKQKVPCLGGKKVFYFDWNGEKFACFKKKENGGSPCSDCVVGCFREPSYLYQPVKFLLNNFS